MPVNNKSTKKRVAMSFVEDDDEEVEEEEEEWMYTDIYEKKVY